MHVSPPIVIPVPGTLSALDKLLILSSQPEYADSCSPHKEALTVALGDLQGAVERAAGGKQYVQHGVRTTTGICIGRCIIISQSKLNLIKSICYN